MDGRPTWTDCDEAGDYVVPNVLSPRDLVFRPDNMDETVPHTGISTIEFCIRMTTEFKQVRKSDQGQHYNLHRPSYSIEYKQLRFFILHKNNKKFPIKLFRFDLKGPKYVITMITYYSVVNEKLGTVQNDLFVPKIPKILLY